MHSLGVLYRCIVLVLFVWAICNYCKPLLCPYQFQVRVCAFGVGSAILHWWGMHGWGVWGAPGGFLAARLGRGVSGLGWLVGRRVGVLGGGWGLFR
jgi:hypothetical protein